MLADDYIARTIYLNLVEHQSVAAYVKTGIVAAVYAGT